MAPKNVVYQVLAAEEKDGGGSESPRRPPSPRTADAAGLRVSKETRNDRVCRRKSDGARHAVGGMPAVVRDNGDLEWYCDDVLHRDENDKPAVRRTSGVSEWRRRGRLDRGGGRPAVDCYDLRSGAVATRRPHREWWVDGRRHRAGGLPAVERADGGDEYWEYGMRHRSGGLPAVVMANGRQEWWENGLLHRGNDLPAVIHCDGTAEWFWLGLRHREGDLPAYVRRTAECIQIRWHEEGDVDVDDDCGFSARRRHYTVVEERWYFHDVLHRGAVDGAHAPAIVCYDQITGEWTSREWYCKGWRHRQCHDAPAVQYADGHEEWWWFDQRHRQHGDWTQPAIVYRNGSCKYFRHGRQQYLPHLVRSVIGAYRAIRAALHCLHCSSSRCLQNDAAQQKLDDDARISAAELGCLLGGRKED